MASTSDLIATYFTLQSLIHILQYFFNPIVYFQFRKIDINVDSSSTSIGNSFQTFKFVNNIFTLSILKYINSNNSISNAFRTSLSRFHKTGREMNEVERKNSHLHSSRDLMSMQYRLHKQLCILFCSTCMVVVLRMELNENAHF